MLYDVLTEFPVLQTSYESHKDAEQALRDHEAKHAEHMTLWQAVRQWLTRHQAQLISDLPGLLLDRLAGGDFTTRFYRHVIVDEFQDLTPGEQELFLKLRCPGGHFLALGDPRQSIYAFRGNDREGLTKLEILLGPAGGRVTDIEMTECQRCPGDIVSAANQLMNLYTAKPMVPGSAIPANTHVVVWDTPEFEASGMAKAIVANVQAHPKDRHLVMVTRRQFGYWLRDRIAAIAPHLKVELSFSESLLETWAVREAFLLFCLLVDPDPPTWRAWLGYQDSSTGKGYKAARRNSGAYLKLLTDCNDKITAEAIAEVAAASKKPPGDGGTKLWQRATRLVTLAEAITSTIDTPDDFVRDVFAPERWISAETADAETAKLDLALCTSKAIAILDEIRTHKPKAGAASWLRDVARRLRYQIATREPFVPDETADIQVATLWGAKGVTADHVYAIGLCDEAIPGTRRDEYPGTDRDYEEEQRRLFYVSITRSKRTLVLSRGEGIRPGDALRLGLTVTPTSRYWATLTMSRFLRDIIKYLPKAQPGEAWHGCA
jgi:DNA helicase-2/ATP-dependent DNA helicase PcrA